MREKVWGTERKLRIEVLLLLVFFFQKLSVSGLIN